MRFVGEAMTMRQAATALGIGFVPTWRIDLREICDLENLTPHRAEHGPWRLDAAEVASRCAPPPDTSDRDHR